MVITQRQRRKRSSYSRSRIRLLPRRGVVPTEVEGVLGVVPKLKLFGCVELFGKGSPAPLEALGIDPNGCPLLGTALPNG